MNSKIKDWKKPKPINWRGKDHGCEAHESWAYKRNYKAVTFNIDGDRFKYRIYEVSDKENPKLVLAIESSGFPYDMYDRCEQLLRSYAKGKNPALNKTELKLLEQDSKYSDCIYKPDNIKFMPYSTESDFDCMESIGLND